MFYHYHHYSVSAFLPDIYLFVLQYSCRVQFHSRPQSLRFKTSNTGDEVEFYSRISQACAEPTPLAEWVDKAFIMVSLLASAAPMSRPNPF